MSASAVHPSPEAGIKEINRDKHDEERRSVLIKPKSADGDDTYFGGYLRRADVTKPEQLRPTLGKRRIDRRERMCGFHIVDFSNSWAKSRAAR